MLSLLAGASASAKTLAQLCDRLALSLSAGIDIRRVWQSESHRLRGHGGRIAAEVAGAIQAGQPLDEAMAEAGGAYFPPLLLEMVAVGERTGTTAEVFRRLAKHYERRVSRSRDFFAAIAWPMLQLVVALGVVGLVILVGGFIEIRPGVPLDLFGFGLTGERGLLIYANVLFGLGLLVGLTAMAFRRRPDWSAACLGAAMGLPIVGSALRKLALARIAWSLRLMLNVDMDLRHVIPAALRASGASRFTRHTEMVVATVERGEPMSVGFEKTREFPRQFLDLLEVAETSGTLVESLDRLAKRYDEEAEHAVNLLARAAAFLVWVGVAAIIITLIFRVFSFYTGAIYDALEGV